MANASFEKFDVPQAQDHFQNVLTQQEYRSRAYAVPFNQYQVQGANPEWVSEFSALSIHQNQSVPGSFAASAETHLLQQTPPEILYRPGPHQVPGFFRAPGPAQPAIITQAQALQPDLDSKFDKEFAHIENQLQLESSINSERARDEDAQDVSRIAKDVVQTIERSEVDAVVTDKLRSSKFMALMDRLSSKEAALGKDAFVATDGTELDTAGLMRKEIFDTTEDERFKPSSVEKSQSKVGEQPTLEDPITYYMRVNQVTDEMSPFAEANKLGPTKIPMSQWEEDYDDLGAWFHVKP